uniref:Coatomer subunit epsilon n=1 Tax=Globodera rostochiensis TaxID=31243 RepID=A0A914H8K9_GLORO
MDALFDVRNNFYLGAFQQCINEAQKAKCKTDEEKALKDSFLYRAYIGLNKYSIPLGEIDADGGGSTALRAIHRFAVFMSSPEKRSAVVEEVANELESKKHSDNELFLLISALIFMHEERVEDALRVLNRAPPDSLECAALRVQCLLKLCRGDLAAKEVKRMQETDEDATITQLAQAWLNMAMGRDKLKDAFYIYQEMLDKYGATPLLLTSQAACLIMQQKYEEAEKLLLSAQERDPNNADVLVALFAVSQFLGKPIEMSSRYMNQLKQDHPMHRRVTNKQLVGAAFGVSVQQMREGRPSHNFPMPPPVI